MATKKRALATSDQGRTARHQGVVATAGPEVMGVPSLAVARKICGAGDVGFARNRVENRDSRNIIGLPTHTGRYVCKTYYQNCQTGGVLGSGGGGADRHMLEDVPGGKIFSRLRSSIEATKAWVELRYNRKVHSRSGKHPLRASIAGPEVTRLVSGQR